MLATIALEAGRPQTAMRARLTYDALETRDAVLAQVAISAGTTHLPVRAGVALRTSVPQPTVRAPIAKLALKEEHIVLAYALAFWQARHFSTACSGSMRKDALLENGRIRTSRRSSRGMTMRTHAVIFPLPAALFQQRPATQTYFMHTSNAVSLEHESHRGAGAAAALGVVRCPTRCGRLRVA